MPIETSVGDNKPNRTADVRYVQSLLNVTRSDLGLPPLELDGLWGHDTKQAVLDFQGTLPNHPMDGTVEPGKRTILALEALVTPYMGDMLFSCLSALTLSLENAEAQEFPDDPSVFYMHDDFLINHAQFLSDV